MRPFALVLVVFILACEEPPRPRTAAELLCRPGEEPLAYGEFYWDELRRSDPPSFDQAHEICSRRCPRSVPCGPVLSVARWYTEPLGTLSEAEPPSGEPHGSPEEGGI